MQQTNPILNIKQNWTASDDIALFTEWDITTRKV